MALSHSTIRPRCATISLSWGRWLLSCAGAGSQLSRGRFSPSAKPRRPSSPRCLPAGRGAFVLGGATMVKTYECMVCGKPFRRKEVMAERSKVKCCSHRCWGDYQTGKKHGHRNTPTEVRFWSKVNRSAPNECWIWAGAHNAGGYGNFLADDGTITSAHRVAWILTHGPIPKSNGYHGTCVCHSCDRRDCVNPAHLFLSDQRGNVRDMRSKGRGVFRTGERLKASVVAAICAEDSDASATVVASRYGVCPATVRRIRKRIREAAVPESPAIALAL